MADFKMKDIDENEIDTILGEDIDFHGIISFDKELMVKGKITGEIKAAGNLFVDKDAEVNARVEAGIVTSKGHIVGDIFAHHKVALYSTAVIEGNVSTPEIEIESGAKINGHCNMRSDEPSIDSDVEENKINDIQSQVVHKKEFQPANSSVDVDNHYQSQNQNNDSKNGDNHYE